MGSRAGRAGVSPWSDLPVSGRATVPPRSALPLNRVLYIPFSIFAYSSNIVIASLVRINSILSEGTLKRPSGSSDPHRGLHKRAYVDAAHCCCLFIEYHPCLLAQHTNSVRCVVLLPVYTCRGKPVRVVVRVTLSGMKCVVNHVKDHWWRTMGVTHYGRKPMY